MLGLGSNITKGGAGAKTIVTEGLVLKHNYAVGAVQPISSGAANINADANGTEFIDVGVIEATTNDVTISAWVYITDWINYAAIFQNRHATSPTQGFAIRTMSAKTFDLITDKGSASTSSTSSAKNNNQWYHVCAVLDRSGNQYLYVDGVLEDSDDISGYSADSLTHTTSARIGKNHNSNEINGYVCNVGYWNAALTQAQIKSIMQKDYAGLSDSEKTSLVSWWNLDSVVEDTTTLVYDNHYGGEGEVLGSDLVPSIASIVNSGGGTITPISGNSYSSTSDGTSGSSIRPKLDFATTAGKTYKLTITPTGTTSGTVKFKFYDGSSYIFENYDFSTTKEIYFNDNGSVSGVFNGTETYSVSSFTVSIKLINGNTGTLS